MSRVIEIRTPIYGHRLYDELLAALPALRPVAGVAQFKMVGGAEAGTTRLIVPDDADEAAIQAVIAAHDPTPPPPKPTRAEIRKAARDEILAIIAQPGGDAQTRAMLRAVLTRLLDMIDATSPT